MPRIKSLVVDKISLLTAWHNPAVKKAGIGYSIMKFFRPSGAKKIDKSRLDGIIKSLSGEETKSSGRLDDIIEAMDEISKGAAGSWDTTTDMYRYRIRAPGDFEKDSFKTIQLNKTGKTIKSVMWKLKGQTTMTMQNVMFPKDEWTQEEAKKWVKDHKKDWTK